MLVACIHMWIFVLHMGEYMIRLGLVKLVQEFTISRAHDSTIPRWPTRLTSITVPSIRYSVYQHGLISKCVIAEMAKKKTQWSPGFLTLSDLIA